MDGFLFCSIVRYGIPDFDAEWRCHHLHCAIHSAGEQPYDHSQRDIGD